MDIKKAYKIMELSEGSTLEELEDKFFILIKRQNTNSNGNNSEAENDHHQLNEAYAIVKADILGEDQNIESKNPTREKMEHIIYHYKFHIIGGILLVVLLGYFASTIITSQIEKANQISPSLTVVMLGNYEGDDTSQLEENLANLFPKWEYIKFEFLSNPNEEDNATQQSYGQVIKNQVVLANTKPDVLIVDQKHYNSYVTNGSFLPLEDRLSYNVLEQIAPDQLLYNRTEEDNQEKLYGIEITDNALFQNVNISGDKILAIRQGAKEMDKAITFINTVVE